MTPTTTRAFATRALCILAALAALAPLTGCALVASWPAIGDDSAVNDPNVSPMPKVIAAGVREAIAKFPPEGEFVVNLPEGLERFRAERIASEISPSARVVDAANQTLPVYHITRVWVRGDRAQVDVVRPLDEPRSWQRVTVHLRHSLEGWQRSTLKVWPLGMAAPGALYGWLDAGAVGDPPAYLDTTPPATNSNPPPATYTTPGEVEMQPFPEDGLQQSIEVQEGGAQ
jgi:hypothetical protein